MDRTATGLFVGFGLLIIGAIVAYAVIQPRNTETNTHVLILSIAATSFFPIVFGGLIFFFLRQDPEYLMKFLVLFVTGILIPTALISTAISVTTVENLKDILAVS